MKFDKVRRGLESEKLRLQLISISPEQQENTTTHLDKSGLLE